MNRGARYALLGMGLLVSILFLAGSTGLTSGVRSGRSSGKGDTTARFHARITGQAGIEPSCQSAKCHPPFPHEKGGTNAVFLNFHAEFTDCRVCHGKTAEGIRFVKDASGRKVLKSGNPAPSPDPHESLVPPAPCRSCHSETGMGGLRSRGLEEFPAGFDNPMALRMIEEKKNRWLPAGLR